MLVDIAITHENGMRTTHQYMVSNDKNLLLVSTGDNSNDRTVYPLVQFPYRPIMGQSSQINHHYRQPGAAPGSSILSEYRARRLRDQAVGLMREPNIIPVGPSPFFMPVALDRPALRVTPLSSKPSIFLNPSNLSSGSDQVVKSPVSTQSCEGVVERRRQPQKGGPYTCERCGDVFEISQTLAAHMMNSHYRGESAVERLARQANRNKRKRANNPQRVDVLNSSPTAPESPIMHTDDAPEEGGEKSNESKDQGDTIVADEPPLGIMHTADPDVCRESGETSGEKKAPEIEEGSNLQEPK